MYIIFLFLLSMTFSTFSYFLTPFQSIFLLSVSGFVLLYIVSVWNSKNKLKLNMSSFLLFALILALSQIFFEVSLLFIYFNIWIMLSSGLLVTLHKLLTKKQDEEVFEAIEVDVEVEKRFNPSHSTNADTYFSNSDRDFVEETDMNFLKNEKELLEIKKDYDKHILEFNEIIELSQLPDMESLKLYELRNRILEKEYKIENLYKNLEDFFIYMTHFRDENLKLSTNLEQLHEEQKYYIDEAISYEEKYTDEKKKVEEVLNKINNYKKEVSMYEEKNSNLIKSIEGKTQQNIDHLKNKRKNIQKRWVILYNSFNFKPKVFRDVSKFPSKDIVYIEVALNKLFLSDDPKKLSRGQLRGHKKKVPLEHMGVEQTDVPYRIAYTIVNEGKIRLEIEDIYKHNEKKFS